MAPTTTPRLVLAFDLYGTLLSTASIAQALAVHFGQPRADAIAALWRRYQLEYTWRMNSMQQYASFSTLTHRALSNALGAHGVFLSDNDTAALMAAYSTLAPFPDALPALAALRSAADVTPVIFSNGDAAMVEASVRTSALGAHEGVFAARVSVEAARRFKPAPEAYAVLAAAVGRDGRRPEELAEIWLVTGNAFDVVGARAAGMHAVWVDREGTGWVDGMVEGELGRPTLVVQELGEVLGAVRKFVERGA